MRVLRSKMIGYLQRNDRTPGGLAGLEVAVCLLHVGQRVSLVDADFDGPAQDHAEQVVGHFHVDLVRGYVRKQGLARDIN